VCPEKEKVQEKERRPRRVEKQKVACVAKPQEA